MHNQYVGKESYFNYGCPNLNCPKTKALILQNVVQKPISLCLQNASTEPTIIWIVPFSSHILVSITQYIASPFLNCCVECESFQLVKLLCIHFDHQLEMDS
jgi:hypothetical protein